MLFLKRALASTFLVLIYEKDDTSAKLNIHYPDDAMSYDERENVKSMILR